MIKDNKWKYIFTEKSKLRDVKKMGSEELYNLIEDSQESQNLIGHEPEILKLMREKLNLYKTYCKEKAAQSVHVELDQETLRNLKSLGYIK